MEEHSRVQILPSILAADFSDIAKEIRTVESAGARCAASRLDGRILCTQSFLGSENRRQPAAR
jgi:hypothetical protein